MGLSQAVRRGRLGQEVRPGKVYMAQAARSSGHEPDTLIKICRLSRNLGAAAADYALSVAHAFEAHVAGIGFAFEPVMPGDRGRNSAELIDAQRREGKDAAQAAIARFDEAARRGGLSAETRLLSATMAGAADIVRPAWDAASISRWSSGGTRERAARGNDRRGRVVRFGTVRCSSCPISSGPGSSSIT